MNWKYINVMVEKKNHQKAVAKLLDGLESSARMVEEREHGYIIRVGAASNEILDEIKLRSISL